MTAIILGWNPDDWDRWNYPAAAAQVRVTGLVVQRWNVSGHRDLPAGADAWLVLQGSHAGGLLGHGVVVSEHAETAAEPAVERHGPQELPEHGPREQTVLIAFDAFLPLGEQVPVDVLHDAAPGIPWDGVPDSGLHVEPAEEATIRGLWGEFGPQPGPDPTEPAPGTYPQDAVARVLVNRYERDEEARRACLARHGTSCAACGFSFELKYGETGRDFIQVHHIVPVAQLGSGYQLDPITDLVPLCANCHAMAHLGAGAPRTVAELRRIIGEAGYLRGSTVSPQELEAQREARRMLGN
ncbi:MAG: endonuclease [Arthrobacter sp.]|nr:endonuclease [Arthrobacter sp.]